MSLKSRLRRLAIDVEWLATEGRFRRYAEITDILDRKEEMSDFLARHPKAVALYDADLLDALNLPPPRVDARLPAELPIPP
jgi:hypothetical protein